MELKELGLTQEQIFEAVVNKISSELLQKPIKGIDEDTGEEYDDYESTVYCQQLRKQIKAKIDTTIEVIIDKIVLPNAEQRINDIVLQPTSRWGEPKGEPLTFVDYLTKRAEEFMLEEVNYEGKTKGQDSFSWHKKGTRIAYMIDKYLYYHIENWAKTALVEANKTLVDGLQKTVEIKLQEVLTKLKFGVSTK